MRIESPPSCQLAHERGGDDTGEGRAWLSHERCLETMDKSRDDESDEPVTEDPIEKRLAAARERLREAHQRLSTREHAIIDAGAPPPSAEDDPPTEPSIIVPKKR